MRTLVGLVAVAGLLVLGSAQAAEKVAVEKLPPSVTDAVKSEFPGSQITAAKVSEDAGQQRYEMIIRQGTTDSTLKMSSKGSVLAVTPGVAPSMQPSPVVTTTQDQPVYERRGLRARLGLGSRFARR